MNAQTPILLSCIGVLILALMLRAREAFNRAATRNVPLRDLPQFWDALETLDGAHDTLKGINSELERAHRQLDSLRQKTAQARQDSHRDMVALKVKTAFEPRRSPVPPKPAAKKSQPKR